MTLSLPKPKRERDEAYLAWIRTLSCLCAGVKATICCGPVEAHHIRKGASSGVGTKPSDRLAVPLCQAHHDTYHFYGHESFERAYSLLLSQHVWGAEPRV